MSNTTLISADRVTHLKIAGVAIIASVAVGLVGFNARGMQAASVARLQPTRAPITTDGSVKSTFLNKFDALNFAREQSDKRRIF